MRAFAAFSTAHLSFGNHEKTIYRMIPLKKTNPRTSPRTGVIKAPRAVAGHAGSAQTDVHVGSAQFDGVEHDQEHSSVWHSETHPSATQTGGSGRQLSVHAGQPSSVSVPVGVGHVTEQVGLRAAHAALLAQDVTLQLSGLQTPLQTAKQFAGSRPVQFHTHGGSAFTATKTNANKTSISNKKHESACIWRQIDSKS
jgi:hypothetical protein